MSATLITQSRRQFKLRVLSLMVGLALLSMSNQESEARANETTAAFTATQLVRQFTLKNTVAQVNQGMQGYVQEVNGQLRSVGMGPTPTNYPVGMGSVPGTVNLPQRDGAGRPLGYCAWDNTSGTSNASFLAGSGVANPLVHAVISPGLNGAIETSCAEILLNGVGNSDDFVLTTAPTQASSKQFRSSVGTEAELFAMTGENGDVRLVTETNRLYSYLNGSWSAIGPATTFTDDSAANGAGAISYTAGKVTVGDFEAAVAAINSTLTVGGATALNGGLAVTGDSSFVGTLMATGIISSTTGFSGNGALLTDLNASAITSGVLGVQQGGTGVTGVPLQGQLLIGTGAGYALGGIVGSANQINVAYDAGNIAISLPQDIAITSIPTFGGLNVNGVITANTAIFSGALTADRLNLGSAAGGVSVPNLIIGNGAMPSAQSGLGNNTAIGIQALEANTSGYNNVAVGEDALLKNTTGYKNTAVGEDALFFNTTGSRNTAIGEDSLQANTSGEYNTGVGKNSLLSNMTGSFNSALGYGADVTSGALSYATAIGANSTVATNNTLVLGRNGILDQVVIGADSRNDTYANTKLYVNGLTFINGDLRGTTATFTGAVNVGSLTLAGVPATLAFSYANSTGDPMYRDNLALGIGALAGEKRGGNLALGPLAMSNLIGSANTTHGTRNTAIGSEAMFANQTGRDNVAVGQATLYSNTTGDFNTALGRAAMFSNTTGQYNSAVGLEALFYNTTGNFNTATGNAAMFNNTSGVFNSAFGHDALFLNTIGNFNTALGQSALYNSTGSRNTSVGQSSLFANTAGDLNTAVGQFALGANTTGSGNVAVGQAALAGVVSGRYSTGLGQAADTNFNGLDYVTVIGANSRVSTSNTVILGALAANKSAAVSTTDDQVVIGAVSRNDTQPNTKLFVDGVVNIADKLYVNGVEINRNGTTNASDINSGLLGTAFGGTGLDGSAAANGQLLIGNGSGFTLASITGTANQINVVNGAGSITLSLSQDIATTSTPTFGGVTLNGALAGTTANFSGRLDAATLFIGGVEVLPVTKASVDAALTFSSDTGDINFNQPNLSVGAGALSASNRAANVAIGSSVLGMLTADPDGSKGVDNTGVGYRALYSTSTGYRNTAVGARAAYSMTTGYANTMIGRGAGYGITTGYDNTVLGENAMYNAAAAYQNIAIGKNSLLAANTAYNNIALGNNALLVLTSGYENTGVGRSALNSTTSGFRNIGVGMEALRSNTTGNYNMGIGYRADVTVNNLVYAQAIGNMAQVATSNTLVLGGLGANKFGSTTDDQVVIGATSRNDTVANTKLFVQGASNLNGDLRGTTATFSGEVIVNNNLRVRTNSLLSFQSADGTGSPLFMQRNDDGPNGASLRLSMGNFNVGFASSDTSRFQIGNRESGVFDAQFEVAANGEVRSDSTMSAVSFNSTSDRRLKTNIQAVGDDALAARLASLQPYTYNYIKAPEAGRRFGVIAQELLPVFPEAVFMGANGFYSVDYGAIGVLAAAGVGRLNDRVVELDKAFKESGSAQTVERINTLETTVGDHGQRIGVLESWKLSTEKQLIKTDERLGTLESWRTSATEKMDTMQTAIDLNIQKIAANAVAIQANTVAIERLDDALFTLDGRVKNNSDLIDSINARWNQNFSTSEDGSLLTVNAVELKVSNFTTQNMRANSVYAQRLEAEMARIAELEVNSLRANSAVANTVQAEQLNTGSTQVYAGVGMPAVLFSAKSDGHYTVNTSALDGSYATATVIVNAGQAKVVAGQNEGIELYAEGNTVKALAAGKSIRASWIKTG